MIKNIFLVSCAVLIISGLPYYAQDFSALVSNDTGQEQPASKPTPAKAQKTLSQATAHYTTGVRAATVPMSRNGHFTADFRINGRSIQGLIDTGATYVAINASTARHLGLRLSASDYKHQVRTANGTTSAALIDLERMQIGAISVENVEAFVLDDKALSTTLIGMSFMSKLQSYRVHNNRMELVN
ncbi:aspartyl protease family protein [Hoeflea halophila]|uniref:Aspartyl protease family protein n=1 Tax=Hoeflea halophila TaxID=714899 RepID=A0A286IAE9_9HYPH|nr:TIGR02281 family clan AA aspartic protease [Hoeflea halophila]SOE17088.1 aspartyl protease family protein [Hoeflea halophila]